jgi:hypothetical protein
MLSGRIYAFSCFSIVAIFFLGLGYLMVLKPEKYVDLRNWHFRTAHIERRLTVERCSRIDHRLAGFALFFFGALMLYMILRRAIS